VRFFYFCNCIWIFSKWQTSGNSLASETTRARASKKFIYMYRKSFADCFRLDYQGSSLSPRPVINACIHDWMSRTARRYFRESLQSVKDIIHVHDAWPAVARYQTAQRCFVRRCLTIFPFLRSGRRWYSRARARARAREDRRENWESDGLIDRRGKCDN